MPLAQLFLLVFFFPLLDILLAVSSYHLPSHLPRKR
jgi:hypothetical protein